MTNTMARLPHAFRRIQLRLAREPGHPDGDPNDGYTLIAPLLEDGRIDAAMVREHRDACRVVRAHAGETSIGHLVHGPGGHWRFEYDVSGIAETERGFRLEDECVREGEYISIVRQDGEHPYRVTAVSKV